MRVNIRKMSLKQLQELIQEGGTEQYTEVIRLLHSDPRGGAQRLVRICQQRLADSQRQHDRFERMFSYERQVWAMGYRQVAGVAEVGRGPLAGPVVAAAVILPAECRLPGLEECKRLSVKRRHEMYDLIRGTATAVGIGMVQPDGIDESSVTMATYQAMAKAVAALMPQPDYLLVDGIHIPYVSQPQSAVAAGESHSAAIASASIIAKVVRDQHMVEMDRQYPDYGFAHHKGYGTAEHRQSLARLGPSPIHRRASAGGRGLFAMDQMASAKT